MTIEQIDNKRLVISLSQEEIEILDTSFKDPNNGDLQKLIIELLSFSKEQCGFSVDNNKILVEVIYKHYKCLIFITILPETDKLKRQTYKIKNCPGPIIFIFKDIENIISAVKKINILNFSNPESKLIEHKNCYFLILYPLRPLPIKIKLTLNEYGKTYGKGNIKTAKIQEIGNILISNNAIEIISKCFNNSK